MAKYNSHPLILSKNYFDSLSLKLINLVCNLPHKHFSSLSLKFSFGPSNLISLLKWSFYLHPILRAFPMAYEKFNPNFSLKSYFFYFVQSFFKTPSIRFSISNSILFKYYFFINFLLLFSTQLKPNKYPKKNLQQLHQQSPATSTKKKNPTNLQTLTARLQKIIANL